MKRPGQIALLRFGYTLADLDALAKGAVRRSRGFAKDSHDAFDLAYSAIAEALYAAGDEPSRYDLMGAGMTALQAEVRSDMQSHGKRPPEHGGGVHPAFLRYWGDVVTWFPEERICEGFALPAVLAELSADEYDVVSAMAAHGSTALAADALGLARVTYQRKLKAVRAKIADLWYDFEKPPVLDKPDTCKSGHPHALHRTRRANGWYCKECERQRQKRKVARGERRMDPMGAPDKAS